MALNVRCYSCGTPIKPEVFEEIQKSRNKKLKQLSKLRSSDPEEYLKLNGSPINLKLSLKDEFSKFGITRFCCIKAYTAPSGIDFQLIGMNCHGVEIAASSLSGAEIKPTE